MNNEQNNIIGGINPIPPTGNQNPPTGKNNQENIVTTGNSQSMANNGIPGSSINPIGIVSEPVINSTIPTQQQENQNLVDTIPITPVPDQIPQEQNSNSQVSNSIGENILSVNSTTVVPEINMNNNNLTKTNQNSNTVIPELKINDANPFDIGIGTSSPMGATTTQTIDPSTAVTTNIPNDIASNTETTSQQTISSNSAPLTNTITSNAASSDDNIVSVGKYLGHMILFAIPIVGFIMLLVKAFDKKDKNISNYAKAQLLLVIITAIISIVFVILFRSLFVNTLPGTIGM